MTSHCSSADEPPPERRAGHAEVGAGDRAVERVGQVAEPGPGRRGRPRPATARAGRRAARSADRAHGEADRGPLRGASGPAPRWRRRARPSVGRSAAGRAAGAAGAAGRAAAGAASGPPASRCWRPPGAGRPARSPSATAGTPATPASASVSCRTVARSTSSPPAGGPISRAEPLDDRVQVGGEPAQRGLPLGDRPLQQARAARRMPGCLDGGGGQHRHAGQPVRRRAAGAGRRARLQSAAEQPVGLVEHDDRDVAVPVELRAGSCCARPGRRTSAGRPPRRPGRRGRAAGRPRAGGPARPSRSRAGRAAPARAAPPRRRRRARSPGRSGAGAARRASRAAGRAVRRPQTQACATPVVGRRTPDRRQLQPASALNRLDLPLPVAPASATTVWSRDSASRLPARSTRVCAATSRSSGRWPSTASRNRRSAVEPAHQRVGVDPSVAAERVADPADDVMAHREPCGSPAAQRPSAGAAALVGPRSLGRGRARSTAAARPRRRRARRARLRKRAASASSRRRPGRAGPAGPSRPGCGSPGRRRSPRAPSARRPWCRPPTAISGAGRDERGRGEHGDHHGEAEGVDRVRAPRGPRTACRRASARTRSSTPRCQSRTSRSARSRQVGGRPASAGFEQRRARPGAPASRCTPARPRPAATPRSSVTSCDSSAAGSCWPGAGRPVTAATTRSRRRPTRASQAAQELAGADELLPAGQHLAAQQPAVAQALLDRARAPRGRRARTRSSRARGGRGLVVGRVGEPVDGRDQRGERAVERSAGPRRRGRRRRRRAGRTSRAAGRCRGRAAGPGRRRRSPAARTAAPRRGRWRPASRRRCAGDLVGGLRRHPVEHQRDHGAAQPGGAQQLPRHGVGVAGRGRDEQPQVGRGQQLRGELAGWRRRPSRCRARRGRPGRGSARAPRPAGGVRGSSLG